MTRNKILGYLVLFVPFFLGGCSKEGVQLEKISTEVNNENEFNLGLNFLGKKEYKDIKIKIPKNLKQVKINDDRILYTIEDTKRSIGVSCDYLGDKTLDEYIEIVDEVLGSSINLKDSMKEAIKIKNVDTRAFEYKYKLNSNNCSVYQKCFKYKGLAYIVTLCSDKDNINDDKYIVEGMIDSIFKYI